MGPESGQRTHFRAKWHLGGRQRRLSLSFTIVGGFFGAIFFVCGVVAAVLSQMRLPARARVCLLVTWALILLH